MSAPPHPGHQQPRMVRMMSHPLNVVRRPSCPTTHPSYPPGTTPICRPPHLHRCVILNSDQNGRYRCSKINADLNLFQTVVVAETMVRILHLGS